LKHRATTSKAYNSNTVKISAMHAMPRVLNAAVVKRALLGRVLVESEELVDPEAPGVVVGPGPAVEVVVGGEAVAVELRYTVSNVTAV
jgi:hypothetical protein